MSKHIVIVGAGVIGLCTARYCAQKGHRVTVLDRNPAPGGGCSFGNAGMIVPSHFIPLAAPGMVALGLKWMWNPESPFYIRPRLDVELARWGFKFWKAANAAQVERAAPLLSQLHFASRSCFEEIAEATGNDFNLVRKGLLVLCRTPEALHEEAKIAEQARGLGVPAEVLNPTQTAELEPNVQMNIAGAIYFPKDCHLTPHKFMATLERELVKAGVTILREREVTGWSLKNKRVRAVEVTNSGKNFTEKQEVSGDEFVICGGSWSPLIARDLGLGIPMQPGKGYSLTLEHPRQLPEICSILTEARVAVTPMGSTLRVGGTMEMAGLDLTINPARVRGIIKSMLQYFPAFQPEDFANIEPWCGLRPCSPDGLPYLGRTGRYPNVLVATGHAMMGLSLGPITGRIVSELVSDIPPSIDTQLLHPDRYE